MEEKEKIEEFEIEKSVEKSVKELKKLWEESEEEAIKKKGRNEFFSFFSSLAFPEISSSLLEKVSNKFLKEFDWKKFEEREYLGADLGFFLSAFLKKSIENCILPQEKKGINKEGNIKPIDVRLNIKKLPVRLDYLGYQNPKKLHLIIEGNCGLEIGGEMRGGEITIEGNCKDWTGLDMKGGELNVKGEVKSFDKSAFSSDNRGTIIWKNTKIWENGNWTKEGKEMWEKGEIPVEG